MGQQTQRQQDDRPNFMNRESGDRDVVVFLKVTWLVRISVEEITPLPNLSTAAPAESVSGIISALMNH